MFSDHSFPTQCLRFADSSKGGVQDLLLCMSCVACIYVKETMNLKISQDPRNNLQ